MPTYDFKCRCGKVYDEFSTTPIRNMSQHESHCPSCNGVETKNTIGAPNIDMHGLTLAPERKKAEFKGKIDRL